MIDLSSIKPGSTLLLHSSASRTIRQHNCKPQDVLDALIGRIGASGTLILPLFNFDFTKGVPFDIRSTPSQMGILTEIGRLLPDAVRTGHPIYSFAAIGAKAAEFECLDNKSGYGPDLPFAKLRELGGEIGVLDLPDQNSMTFYHHVEEMHEVPYRYKKTFVAPYTDAAGHTEQRGYDLFVRDIDRGVLTSVDRMGERLWDKGLYRGDRPGHNTGLRVIDANILFEETAAIIANGEAMDFLYEIDAS